jgi:putative membrane protein
MIEGFLLFTGALIWTVAAINPVDRAAWVLENILLAVGVIWIVATYRKWRLSAPSYLLIFIFFAMHVLGAHYTYSETPVGDWLRSFLGSERNHYDRAVHFLFGLLLVSPFRDQVERGARVGRRAAWGAALLIITALSTAYEIAEWLVAELVSPDNANAFLGTQGDAFDAQKDMGLAIAGAFLGLALALFLRWSSSRLIARR